MSHRIAALVLAVVAALGLTSCTGSPGATGSVSASPGIDQPGDDGQSTEDACALIQESIQEATAEFESTATTDPATAAEAMTSAAERLTANAAEITNDEVAALLPSLRDMFAEVGAVMDEIVQGDASKVPELSRLGTELRETSEAFQEVCG
ncbi:MAG TPA: hypothetical protein VF231_08305 [Candidatus Limnocylindrales bacterium]